MLKESDPLFALPAQIEDLVSNLCGMGARFHYQYKIPQIEHGFSSVKFKPQIPEDIKSTTYIKVGEIVATLPVPDGILEARHTHKDTHLVIKGVPVEIVEVRSK